MSHPIRIRWLFAALLVSMLSVPSFGSGPVSKGAISLEEVDLRILPAVDHEILLAEDRANSGPGVPLRFAKQLDVFLTPYSSGTWELLKNGTALWRLRIRSPGARSLSFAFARYSMPEDSSLLIYSPDGAMVQGPYTHRDDKPHGQLWTPIVLGDEAVIELRTPAGSQPRLLLTAVFHGYRGLDGSAFGVDKSGSCNIDVACLEGNAWDPQIRSVARIVINGFSLCSGFMIDNVNQDFTPYFMTADHCGLTAANAASLVVYWNFENSTCRNVGSSGGPGDGNLTQNQTGSTYLAGSSQSDFTLVKLDSPPPSAYNVYWAGWDARNVDFPSAVTVHHPMGEEKRISFEDEPTDTKSYLCPDNPGFNNCFGPENDGTHIRVVDWDAGTTEGGSSGSPLFSPGGHVIGQLHGGYAACGNNLPDWYGRLSTSWSLGLSDWLDPDDTGTLVLSGSSSSILLDGFEFGDLRAWTGSSP